MEFKSTHKKYGNIVLVWNERRHAINLLKKCLNAIDKSIYVTPINLGYFAQ